ncbi:FecR family protein [Sphingobacterium bambusae]|uniref:FecR family protein n=1 Tax=Sphingobacterium bambusae TaxID=662858 RepID=A0ABW6BCL4_9SPHI|nr:FecR family protein [Sphingobacterium bambusae]WPL47158.1 FecR family protein [Sphingobacterium bambusae]
MDTTPFDIADILVKKFKMISVSEEEALFLEFWLSKSVKNQALFNKLMQDGADFDSFWLDQLKEEEAWNSVQRKRQPRKYRFKIFAAAASMAVFLAFASYWFFVQSQEEQTRHIVEKVDGKEKHDVLPANLGAKIILANGRELQVEDTLDIVSDHKFTKSAIDGDEPIESNQMVYHTLLVPAANFFKLTLADGTAVWVNSKSELRFPTTFSGSERRVFLRGEAYFEVAKNAEKPFYVKTEDAEVKVLGTHFNVSTYGKASKTSLEEGRVEVSSNDKTVLVFPGQSVQWSNGELKVKPTNLQKDLAWKNNEFYFKEDNILNIAHQLKLWYDLEVSISTDVALDATYSGEIRRNVRLSEVLRMMAFVSDLDFKLNKNKLLITKK